MADLTVRILGEASGLSRELKKASGDANRFSSTIKKVGRVGALALGGLATAAVAFGAASVKASIEESKAQALLATSLQKTTGATKEQVAGVEDWITSTQNASGILDDELRPALSTALRATGDVTKAQKLLKLAMDVSTATGKPLATVTLALSRGYQGNTTALGRLGVATKDAQGKALKFSEIQSQLEAKMGGSTAAAAGTLAGKIAIAKAKFEDIKETIGAKLIPILLKAVGVVEKVTSWFAKNKAAAVALAAIVGGGLLAAVAAYTVAMVAAAAATIAATWPILAIIAAVAALTAGAILLYKNWDSIWAKIKSSPAYPVIAVAIAAIKQQIDVLRVVIQWFSDHWPAIWANISAAVKTEAAIITNALRPVVAILDAIRAGAEQLGNWVDKIPGMKGEDWNAPGNPGNPNSSSRVVPPFRGHALGGVVSGPKSGYWARLHGTERITPVGSGTSGGMTFAPIIQVSNRDDGMAIARKLETAVRSGQGAGLVKALAAKGVG